MTVIKDKEKIKSEIKEYIEQDEDVLSYALLPQVAEKFFNGRIEKRNKVEEVKNEDEVIAVISAAVNSLNTTPGCKLVVKSFKRITQTSTIWSTTGRVERFQSKL